MLERIDQFWCCGVRGRRGNNPVCWFQIETNSSFSSAMKYSLSNNKTLWTSQSFIEIDESQQNSEPLRILRYSHLRYCLTIFRTSITVLLTRMKIIFSIIIGNNEGIHSLIENGHYRRIICCFSIRYAYSHYHHSR